MEYEEASIALDLKYYRMRIYRSTLQRLGEPKYIQFLVNPSKKRMGICSADTMKMPDQTSRIDWRYLKNKSYIELKSKRFLLALCSEIPEMQMGHSYRLSGVIIPSEKIVIFPLENICCLERGVQ